jgi:pimeloyl-ACP methyl ester carboxylesterase
MPCSVGPAPLEGGPRSAGPVEAALSRRLLRGSLPGMETRVGEVVVHYVEHGTGRPVLVLHGASVDHREGRRVAGLALVCPLLPGLRDVPAHRVVAGSSEIGDDVFRSYFVIQTPEMLERYQRYVAPAAALVDQAALERIGQRWALTFDHAPAYAGPTAVVAGRLDSTVGYAAATDLVDHYPHASLAVVDDAGHALPHEQPELLRALLVEWLARVERSS